jgi:hypothetical protein
MITRNAIACLATALLALDAHAETITLSATSCDAQRNCAVVNNDSGAQIELLAKPTGMYFTLVLDGVQYHGPNGPTINAVATATMADGSTQQVQVFVDFKVSVNPVRSGRAGYTYHWVITDGSVTR